MSSRTAKRQSTAGPRALIVTALQVEFRAVCEHLEEMEEVKHEEGSIYTRGLFTARGVCWEVFVVEAGTNNARAALETERAIREFDPRLALFVGVAGGLKDVRVGDVVAASEVYNYESGKEAESFQPRPKVGESSYPLVQRARAEARSSEWTHRIKNRQPGHDPQVRVGPIAAGEKVLANTQGPAYQRIRSQYGDALAVEMEGSGFMVAAQANTRVDALVIRGISDLIDGKSEFDSRGWQDVASRHASAFAFETLARLQEPNSPRSKRATFPGRSFILAILAVGGCSWALSVLASRQPRAAPPPVLSRIEGAVEQPKPRPARPPPSTQPRPSWVGPVRTIEELRTLTAVSPSTGASESTTLEQLAPGRFAFIQPWNISPTAEATPYRTSKNIFEVHRLSTGQFVLVGGISQGDSTALKADARRLGLLPATGHGSEHIIGIPFVMIRSTQVRRSAGEVQDVQVELAGL
jgi:nucleoside phosphorylase